MEDLRIDIPSKPLSPDDHDELSAGRRRRHSLVCLRTGPGGEQGAAVSRGYAVRDALMAIVQTTRKREDPIREYRVAFLLTDWN